MVDDLFDDDFSAEEGAVLGGLFGLVEEIEEQERRRKKLEREQLNPDDSDKHRNDEDDDIF